MKHIFALSLLLFSISIYSQNNDWKILEYGVKILEIKVDKNSEELKSGDSISITEYATINLKNEEILSTTKNKEKTTFGSGIINSGVSLIKPEEIYNFKKNSTYKIYQPNFINDELLIEVILDEKTNEKQLTDLNKNVKFLKFINSTKYINPRETNARNYDYLFGKNKYSGSMILHSVQRGTLLIYFNKNQISNKNIDQLEEALSQFNFIKEVSGINFLRKKIKGSIIIMET